jgi:hypothetical protein
MDVACLVNEGPDGGLPALERTEDEGAGDNETYENKRNKRNEKRMWAECFSLAKSPPKETRRTSDSFFVCFVYFRLFRYLIPIEIQYPSMNHFPFHRDIDFLFQAAGEQKRLHVFD